MEWWWTLESVIVRYRSLVRNGSDVEQQQRCVLTLNSMVTQALEQPRAVIFGSKATTEEMDYCIDLILLPNGEAEGDILDDIVEATEKWVGRAFARSMQSVSQAYVNWAKDMWSHKPRYLHQHVKDPGPLEILEVPRAASPGATSDPQVIMAQKVQQWAGPLSGPT